MRGDVGDVGDAGEWRCRLLTVCYEIAFETCVADACVSNGSSSCNENSATLDQFASRRLLDVELGTEQASRMSEGLGDTNAARGSLPQSAVDGDKTQALNRGGALSNVMWRLGALGADRSAALREENAIKAKDEEFPRTKKILPAKVDEVACILLAAVAPLLTSHKTEETSEFSPFALSIMSAAAEIASTVCRARCFLFCT